MTRKKISCYCTSGRGTETFVSQELKRLQSVDEVKVTDGKVYFKISSDDLIFLKSLRSVERIFIKVTQLCTKDLCNGTRFEMSKLYKHLLSEDMWSECVDSFRCLKTEPLCCEASPAKQRKLDSDGYSFRISCKCSGRISRQCHPQTLSRTIGRKLSRLMRWQVELRHPDMEISIHLNDEKFIVGIPISSEPLSKRHYIRHHGLRSTVAWIMCSLANIQPGDLILDPMCGKATILVEGAQNWKNTFFIGVDKCEKQLKIAAENVSFSKTDFVQLIRADVNNLPLGSESVNAVICDLPFGLKHEVEGDIGQLYKTALVQINRVVKPGGHIVLLISCQMENVLLQNVEKEQSHQSCTQQYPPCSTQPCPQSSVKQCLQSSMEQVNQSSAEQCPSFSAQQCSDSFTGQCLQSSTQQCPLSSMEQCPQSFTGQCFQSSKDECPQFSTQDCPQTSMERSPQICKKQSPQSFTEQGPHSAAEHNPVMSKEQSSEVCAQLYFDSQQSSTRGNESTEELENVEKHVLSHVLISMRSSHAFAPNEEERVTKIRTDTPNKMAFFADGKDKAFMEETCDCEDKTDKKSDCGKATPSSDNINETLTSCDTTDVVDKPVQNAFTNANLVCALECNCTSATDKGGDSRAVLPEMKKQLIFEKVTDLVPVDHKTVIIDHGKVHWSIVSNDYIKLGETHSKICTFRKKYKSL